MSTNEDLIALENGVREDPRNAELHYLLGAELAQSGDYTRAVSEMTQAIELEPRLYTARFQLGLLHLTMGQPVMSLSVWAPLEEQPDMALRHFKRGLEALIRDDFANTIAELEAGIKLNESNAPLNNDMTLVIGKVREHLAQPQAEPAAQPVRTDFSLYDQTPR